MSVWKFQHAVLCVCVCMCVSAWNQSNTIIPLLWILGADWRQRRGEISLRTCRRPVFFCDRDHVSVTYPVISLRRFGATRFQVILISRNVQEGPCMLMKLRARLEINYVFCIFKEHKKKKIKSLKRDPLVVFWFIKGDFKNGNKHDRRGKETMVSWVKTYELHMCHDNRSVFFYS